MLNRSIRAATLSLLLASFGCAALKTGLSEAVVIEYDQVTNFTDYQFIKQVKWDDSNEASGIGGADVNQDVTGFWMTFLICAVHNTSPKAVPFTLDFTHFSVVYDGVTYTYQDLEPNTYKSLPGQLPATNQSAAGPVNQQFRIETQIGNSPQSMQVQDYLGLGYRFAIHVHKKIPASIDPTARPSLLYSGVPNVMSPRNQDPAIITTQPAKQSDLITICRPPFK